MKLRELDASFFLRFAGRPLKVEIADADADYWLTALPARHQTVADATKATDRLHRGQPITGLRRMWIKWRLWNQYCAECRDASV